MPKAFPKGFREDVIRVSRDSDASMAQVPKDFSISLSCLKRWLSIDRAEIVVLIRSHQPDGRVRCAALREANKRIKLLEQENEVLCRACG